ncbi:His-Xaa-Ser system protein HxsD [Candidatus Pacearchaeota archaeon]|nr:His-Xaa-Ser system protein HxsD [Candidatus Pacearchaeota archaeon]
MDIPNSETLSDGIVRLTLNTQVYSREAIISTLYLFKHKCFSNLFQYNDTCAKVDFSPLENTGTIGNTVNEFLNELNDQQLRHYIHEETKDIHTAIIKEAFRPLDSLGD